MGRFNKYRWLTKGLCFLGLFFLGMAAPAEAERGKFRVPTVNKTIQAAGGPDAYGYYFKDSNEAGGPAFNFEDISSTGTLILLGDAELSDPVPIGFDFLYYNTRYNHVYIYSNGFLTFLPGQCLAEDCWVGRPIPQAGDPDAIIAGWWEDLDPSAGGQIHYQTLGAAPNRRFIVQFKDVPHYGNGPRVTLQYKFFEGSERIEVHYSAAPTSTTPQLHSAGIEDETGTLGLQYYHGTGSLVTPLAVRYDLPPGVYLKPPSAVLNGEPGSGVGFYLSLANLTGETNSFSLSASGNLWPTALGKGDVGAAIAWRLHPLNFLIRGGMT